MADAVMSPRKGIKDIFYETRALMGRDYTVRRFATEVLGGSVHPLILGQIEKGKRLPNEALVRRLAAVRKEDPHELLVLLCRDRMVQAFAKELRRVLHAPRGMTGIEDADLALLAFRAIAALPEKGGWMPLTRWRVSFRSIPGRRGRAAKATNTLLKQVEETLVEREMVEVRRGKVRRKRYHFVAQGAEERQALAMQFCALFAKGMLDKLALPDVDTGTYLRDHYLHIDAEKLPQFQKELDKALTKLADKFGTDPSSKTRFLNVLATSTPL
jgi:hypothetical protein